MRSIVFAGIFFSFLESVMMRCIVFVCLPQGYIPCFKGLSFDIQGYLLET